MRNTARCSSTTSVSVLILFASMAIATFGCGGESLQERETNAFVAASGVALPTDAQRFRITRSDNGNAAAFLVRFVAPSAEAKKYLDAVGFVEQTRKEGPVHDPTAYYAHGTAWFYKSFKAGEDLSFSTWQPEEKKLFHVYVDDRGEDWDIALDATFWK